VNDADNLPIPPRNMDGGTRTTGITSIEAVGTGAAPAQCENARWFAGAPGASEWWLQARAQDGHLWTLGLHGLGAAPTLKKGDLVNLDLQYRGFQQSSFGPPLGTLLMSDANAAPLLWAVANASGPPQEVSSNVDVWLRFISPERVCQFDSPTTPCMGPEIMLAYTVFVRGEMATLQPFGSADLGGFRVAIGASVLDGQPCAPDYWGSPFEAVAAKLP
jgi:hypothetical protein